VTRTVILLALAGFAGCYGPPAPDAVVCRDLITRLCLGPVCTSAQAALDVPDAGCETELLARTGCGSDEFFSSCPDMATFLNGSKP